MTAMGIDDRTTGLIVAFLRDIRLRVETGSLVEPTFLPGVRIEHGGLIVDPLRLAYPGDLLHEAGHLAVVPPDQRAIMNGDAGDDQANEMMAMGWSYAATVHLGLDPGIVFHDGGYQGGARTMLDSFASGRYLAVPMLQWIGLTFDERNARDEGVPPYPYMVRWLRDATPV